MAEFKLGRIKFVYQGTWTDGQSYVVDDVVTVGGKTYICVVSHTASSAFATDLTHNPPYWNIVADGTQWTGAWQTSYNYNAGDLALWGGIVYICKTAHQSNSSATAYPGGLEADFSKWDEFAANFNWLGDWTVATRYKLNDLVSYGGYTYVCNQAHISDASATNGLEQDQSKWDTFNAGIIYQGVWSGSTVRYKLNDVVKYGADLWICTTKHTSSTTFDYSKWSIFVNGFQFEDSWSDVTEYQLGDIVTYGGNTYTAIQGGTNHVPSTETSYWRPFTSGFEFQGDWSDATAYKIGSVVRLGGYTYLALVDNEVQTITATATTVSTDPTRPNQITIDDSSKLIVGLPISFSGTGFGNIVSGTTYYVSFIVDSLHIRISATQGGPDFDLTTATGTLTGTSNPKPPFTSYWTRLNSGLRWNSTTVAYTTVSSTTSSGTGTGAKFDVVTSGTNYTVTLSAGNAGSGYTTSSVLTILGTDVGGISPANDITISVTGTSGGGVSTFTSIGYSVSWVSGVTYVLGDVVYFGANSYICIDAHIATVGNRPDADTTATYWNLLASGAESAVLTTQGDTFYYGANGPTRLPIGTDGQILRVNGNLPSWQYYGQINNLVYVAPTGSDTIADGQGTTIDKPWASIRYACQQIEAGYLNRSAGTLLTLNKQFMMKEVNNYIIKTFTVNITGSTTSDFTSADISMLYVGMPISFSGIGGGVTAGTTYWVKSINSIASSFSISDTQTGSVKSLSSGSTVMTGTYVYSQSKAERDAGLIIDGVIFDITHNGNSRSITNANSFFSNGALVSGVYSYDITPFVSSLNYLRNTLMTSVLANTAPASNYQALNGVSAGNRAQQRIEVSYTAESGIAATAQSLVAIVTTALTAGTNTGLPATINPNTTISAKTGTYNEILPIVLPAFTAIVGDELRSTIVQPGKADQLLATVAPKTQSALTRIRSLIPDLIANNTITPSAGNTATQIKTLPAGSIGTTVAIDNLKTSFDILYQSVASGLGSEPVIVMPTPTNYNTSLTNTAYATTTGSNPTGSTAGYGYGVTQIRQNYAYIVAEVLAFFAAGSYSAVYTSEGTTGPSKGYRDITYILDSILYDMTYGGNTQSLVAGSSFYSISALQVTTAEKPAFIDALGRLKAIITTIVQKGVVSNSSGNNLTQVTGGTAGSAAAGGFAQDRVQDVIDWISNGSGNASVAPYYGWVSSSLQTAYTSLTAQVSNIASDATVWCQKYYQSVAFSTTLATRDAGLIINGLAYDMIFGSNFNAIQAGRAFNRGNPSATTLRNGPELPQTLGAINFMYYKAKQIAASGAAAQIQTTIDDINNYLTGGSAPAQITWSEPGLPAATYTGVTGTVVSGGGNGLAAFTITRSTNGNGYYNYVITPTTPGSSYTTNSKIRILGTAIGGATPTHDIVLNVTQVSTGGVVAVTYSTPKDAVALLESNRAFILAEVIAYINTNYSSITTNSNYTVAKTQRDAEYVLDAIHYDLLYGGNWASQQAGMAYYSALYGSQIASGLNAAFSNTINYISTLAQSIVVGTAIVSPLQITVPQTLQTTSGRTGAAKDATQVAALMTIVKNFVDNGLTTGAPTITVTAIATTDTFTSNGHGLNNGDIVIPQATANGLTSTIIGSSPIYYVVSASTNTFKLATSYAGTALTTFTNGTGLSIKLQAFAMPSLVWVDATSIAAYSAVSASISSYQTGATASFTATFNGTTTITVTAVASGTIANGMYLTGTGIPGGAYIVPGGNGSGGTGTYVLSLATTKGTVASPVAGNSVSAVTTGVIAYLNSNYPALVYNQDYASRDTYNVTLASMLDMLLNSNFAAIQAGRAYNRTQDYQVLGYEKTATIAALNYLSTLVASTLASYSVQLAEARTSIYLTISLLQNGAGKAPEMTGTVTYNNNLGIINGSEILRANIPFLAAETVAYYATAYGGTVSSLGGTATSSSATISGTTLTLGGTIAGTFGVGTILSGVGITAGTYITNVSSGGNYTVNNSQTYSGAVTGSTNVITTSANHNFVANDPVSFKNVTVSTTATAVSGNNITVGTTAGMVVGEQIVFGTKPALGGNLGNLVAGTVYYILTIGSGVITVTTTVGGVSPFAAGTDTGVVTAVAGGVTGGLTMNSTYFVLGVISPTQFVVTTSEGYLNTNTGTVGAVVPVTAVPSPGMTVAYQFVASKAESDMTYFLNALVYDLQYTGNYKSLRNARVLLNAISGSAASDMWYVRNGCGIRNMTMNGLTGTLPPTVNEFGTRRPTGGAFTSLDPGFGPNDSNAWVYSRSTYVQNCTMFGYACTGAKVDGALHAGGYRSMVSNDYTCIIGDGIGWHTTGANSLSELVSVFNYYSYAGYLAELGGRIRATNGNSSYGTYGVVAEGVDTTETPIYGTLNNRSFAAQISNVITDGANSILRFEYSNAGSNYTNAVPNISGSGYNATATHDEFRDSAVFESRLIDVGTTTNSSVGGTNYVTVTNTAQVVAAGLPVDGFIVISATDTALTNAYRGMRIQINAGTGVGQFANILSYANGTKQANIVKESFSTLAITASSTTVFTVASTATLYVGMPIYLNTAFAGLSTDTVYYVLSNNFTATQFSVGTSAGGSVQTLSAVSAVNITVTATSVVNNLITAANTLVAGQTVTFNSSFAGIDSGTLYYVLGTNLTTSSFSVSTTSNGTAVTITATGAASSTGVVGTALYAAGWDHVVPGTTIVNSLDLTTSYQIEPRIIYSAPGYTSTARTLSTTATWSAVAYGDSRYVAVSNTAGATTTSYSSNGTTWTTGGALPTDASATWNSLVYGGGQGARATAVVGGFGGSGAVFQAVIGTGLYATQIVSVNVISGGYNYGTTPPTIVFTGGGGTGATATCTVLNGVVQSVTMVINGSGYSSTPTVTAATNILSSINMDSWGKDYFSTPTITISQPQGLSPTAFALNTSVLLNAYLQTAAGRIYIVTQAGTTDAVTTPAFDYTSANYTNVTNGTAKLTYVATQAQGTPTLTNAGVSSIALTVYGYGYTSVPTVSILDTTAKFVAISSSTTKVGYSTVAGLGSSWSATVSNASTNQNLKSVAYGGGYYVAVGGAAGTGTAASSSDGVTWVSRTPTALSAGYYSAVAFGNGTFVAVNNGARITTVSANSGATWSAGGNLPVSFTTASAIAYGNGRFVVLGSDGKIAYSIDKGTTWVAAPTAIGTTTSILSSSYTWSAITYFEGQFLAIAKATTVCASSWDGVNWTIRSMPSSSNWQAVVGGNIRSATLGPQPLLVAVSNTSGAVGASIRSGATTRGRMRVVQSTGLVSELRLVEPGSGYPKGNVSATTISTNLITVDDTTNLSTSLANNQPIEFTGLDSYGLTTNVTYYVVGSSVTSTQFSVTATPGSTTIVSLTSATGLTGTYRAGPVVTQVDPNKVTNAGIRVRLGDGALGNPSFGNRGTNNATATASTAGDGFGDIYQNSQYINVSGLFAIPSAGANVQFSTITGSAQWYKLVTVTNILGNAGNYTAQFTINPALTTLLAPTNGTLITTRLKYSQVRLTGHDFLYIGTGNQTVTNYPYVDASKAIQANQELNTGGGRTFFTSTDQDGNFNVGNLFGVQQSTGTATLNASAFNLAGLQSLTLGAVSLGVGSATITSFSTDPYFTANSDNVLPTQKAIKSYITAQIGGGSSSLNVNTLTAGQIYIANNSISNTTGGQINVSSKMNFTGGIDGAPVALVFFGQR